MPSGWSVTGVGTSNWSVDASNKAGGQPNELHMAWSPQFNGLSRVLMGTVDLTGVSSAYLSFKHSLDNYSGSTSLGFSTSTDGGTTWHDAWNQSFAASTTAQIMTEVSSSDFGSADVMISFYFNGSSYNVNDWYFDEFQLFTLENLDLSVTAINLADATGSGEIPLSFSVLNYGTTTVTSLEASYQVNDMDPVTETFETNIGSLASGTMEFVTPMNLLPGSYHITVTLNLVNGVEDDVLGNNTKEKNLSVVYGLAERVPMIEHFSSSTCGPCVSVNTQMLNFCNNNPGAFTYTKYQMNWPGNGDPYYTAEGGARRSYYGVSAVPQCFLDGEDQGYAAVAQTTFDEHLARPAFVDLRGYFSVEGTVITVNLDVMSYMDLNARLFVSVNEKETHNNVGGNGETSFHHIFMKMLTPTAGETLQMNAMDIQHFDFSFDMSSTHVEEMEDLEVSMWVQNIGSKEMYNSRFCYTELMPNPVQNLTLVEDEGNGTITATWEAPAEGTPDGYKLILNSETIADNTNETSYVIEAAADQLYIFQVIAYYGATNDGNGEIYSVPVVAAHTMVTSAPETAETLCQVYPNPANTVVRIAADENLQTVNVYNMLGALVRTLEVNGKSVNVNTADLSDGIYFFDLKTEGGMRETRRVVIAH